MHSRVDMSAAISIVKSRVTFPCDVDLDKEAKRADALKEAAPTATADLRFQRLFVHRGLLLALMAFGYVLFFIDNIWSVAVEFRTYDSIKRCPDLGQPEFMNMSTSIRSFEYDYDYDYEDNSADEEENALLQTYYSGRWERCGKTEVGKQHRMYDTTDRAYGSYCFFSLGKGTTFVLIPLHNIATALNDDPSVTNITGFVDGRYDRVNETYAEQFSVYARTDPSLDNWYSEHIASASGNVFGEWASRYAASETFTPTCPSPGDSKETNLKQADGTTVLDTEYDFYGLPYEVRCFSDTGTHYFYYAQCSSSPCPALSSNPTVDFDNFDLESILYVTQETHASYPNQKIFSATNECGAYPTLSRDCCTSKEVMISAKNPPALVRVRKTIAIIKILMNGSSAAAATVAALKWTNLTLTRRLVVFSWLAPFIVSCLLAILPLATMAKLSSDQAYDDSLIKSIDDADVDGVIKFFKLLMPTQTGYLVETMQSFYTENRYAGREVSDLALQIEFRLKTMTATLIPLAMTALSLPGAVTKAAMQVKEFFPSVAWLGWLIRLLPMFYLPWASAVFCSMSQIFAGPFVTCAVVCFLTMRVIDLTYKARSHTGSYASYEEYRKARRPSRFMNFVLKSLLLATLAFLIAALLTDKYLKRLGIKSLVGEVENLGAASAKMIITSLIGFIAKGSNTVIMFTDILVLMTVYVAAAPTSEPDLKLAAMLRSVFDADAAPAQAI